MPDPDGEVYVDAISGRTRPRRGPRTRVKRGAYSLEERRMIEAFDDLLSTQRRMEGELAQATCADVTVFLTALRLECEKYVYENYPDVSGLDPHVVIAALDLPVPGAVSSDDAESDIYEDLT